MFTIKRNRCSRSTGTRNQGEFEIAGRLLLLLEFMLKRPPYLPVGENRRAQESLVAAYERLWEIRHPTPPVVR